MERESQSRISGEGEIEEGNTGGKLMLQKLNPSSSIEA